MRCVAWRIGYWALHPMTSKRLEATRFICVRDEPLKSDGRFGP